MPCTVVVGGFWGDEGKGKIISYLSLRDDVAVGVRGGVGPNAGHTVQIDEKQYKLRMLPSSFVNTKCKCLIGAGVLVNPKIFLEEVELTGCKERAGLDPNCAIIEEKHIEADKSSTYLSKKIGTTGTGTGPCNVDRVKRIAKTAKDIPELKDFLVDVAFEVNKALDEDKNVLIEGTQGTFLSLYHGTYPYCTSKDVTASSICGDVGVGPLRVDNVLVVFKAYITRVGGGPLPNELSRDEAERRGWVEIATVTGRVRRVAPFNIELAKRAIMLNSATQIAITKLDVVYPECRGARKYTDLSEEAKKFIKSIEEALSVPVVFIGTGPDVYDIIDMERAGRVSPVRPKV
ncbi:MAG: adenylosuccinate synthetase [Candidatus Bathyarchaeota archaeon]